MKMTTQAKHWLSRYERAFSRHLPLRSRKDILDEFHSHTLDVLEEQFNNTEVTEDRMRGFLQDLGSPRLKAVPYRKSRTLISPEIFPFFKMVSGIVLLVLTVVLIVTGVIDTGLRNGSPIDLFRLTGDLFTALTSALGSLVIVFTILGRVMPSEKWDSEMDDEIWKVDHLPADEYPLKISISEAVAEIVLSIIAVILFNFFPHLIGIHHFSDTGQTMTPVLAESFWNLLPLLTFRWITGACFSVLLLFYRRWSLPLRLVDLALRAFTLGILFLLFKRGFTSLFLVEELSRTGMTGLVSVFKILFPILMLLGMGGILVEMIKMTIVLYREPADGSDSGLN